MEFLVEPVDVDLLAYFDVDMKMPWTKESCGTYCEKNEIKCTNGYAC